MSEEPAANSSTGIAAGCELPFPSILALNVRTEIRYGLATDGCTALCYSMPSASTTLLAQNWDWQPEQKANLIRLRISQAPKPAIDMITEAGIIGKIGLNSSGVGVCLNAIMVRGVNWNFVPVHLALRLCLDSQSVHAAVRMLQQTGSVASACHITIADAGGGLGFECDYASIHPLNMGEGTYFLSPFSFTRSS